MFSSLHGKYYCRIFQYLIEINKIEREKEGEKKGVTGTSPTQFKAILILFKIKDTSACLNHLFMFYLNQLSRDMEREKERKRELFC